MKLAWSDVTPRSLWLNRRNFIAAGAAAAASPALALQGKPSPYSTDADANTLEEITNYNNFYEFGTGKEDPARHAGQMTVDPWSVEIGGLVERPGSYGVEDLAPDNALEERIYRLRCVEAWSMVIPWIGVPLASVLNKVGVQPGAKYVAFQTALLPDQMPGVRYPILDWPYREGLRIDEAMHPLTILATGLYSDPLPNQNGAPIRLVVPWKYGFKSIKSIVKITLTSEQPVATWKSMQPGEYGFYANVNPEVDHPRWSQATERRIGAGLFGGRQETLMFNGYADQVASLYQGMDLTKNY
ncbi:protein-methionine-sulfoxide reductase catalytic subunit MsrP [Paracoccus sp. R12_1]|jgi:methionine sulfoxide reductase catalytic subunit|uniref:protein-methionine-sulfoxide reductase catalytic subunit MsrP n=1 Tax=unclassified Paracoccus (in: a-proteobacteria) TaxID=2688777 RepID=UPI000C08DE7E|nr:MULTISPECIES: protein-methionine-sulfoxide reductase catalytic subunit MsrP [unclassified Paracoccus (in: a-proteobacteria)]MBO9454103.1 protein-methionine-sulfoxide reductase catalytic subunit MsrP [Paracoccus sp. R12_2]MBO9485550.1 protein-methionine-sulfoxide reductase catalytic subunit MsrP [Paracoccus sp. R12_1]PHQ66711.1 MAG: protein-methionine-sulfoxide reductase catalytic subunit MsrP [Paracoccus sp. (in: a-proteobacteria)]